MDLEKVGSQNWLEMWRKRKGLSPETVDKILSVPLGWTQKYEALGIMRIPCCHLAELARIFRVPALEFHETIWGESRKWIRPR